MTGFRVAKVAAAGYRACSASSMIGDEEYRLYNLDLGLIGFIEQVYAPPRQYGVTLSYRW